MQRKYPYSFRSSEAKKISDAARAGMSGLSEEESDILLAGMVVWQSALEDAISHQKYPIFYPQKTLPDIFAICYPDKWSFAKYGYVETMKTIGRAALFNKTLEFEGVSLVYRDEIPNDYNIPRRFNKYQFLTCSTRKAKNEFCNNPVYIQARWDLEKINFQNNDDTQMFLERIRLAISIPEAEYNISLLLTTCYLELKLSSKSCCGLVGIFGQYPAEMQRAINLLEKMQGEIDSYKNNITEALIKKAQ